MIFRLGDDALSIVDFDHYGITAAQAQAYHESLCAHVAYVREAGQRLGLDLAGHDRSKISVAEFPYYARQFHGDRGDAEGYARAFLHHVHANAHHWQHWNAPLGYTGSAVDGGCLRMPKRDLREMVADWQGASRAYTGSWDIEGWLLDNLSKIRLHTASWAALAATLCEVGYDGKGLVYGR